MSLAAGVSGFLQYVRDPHAYCRGQNVSYSHRVDDNEHFNFCTVPDSAQDAVLFASLAILCSSILTGKLSALRVLIAGAALQGINFIFNLGPISNAVALWLGIEPADVFLYVFLPALLLDSSVRIDFFIFRKLLVPVLTFAFLVVLGCTALLVPVLLYGFQLTKSGWRWQHAALFAAITSSTDAVAVSSLLSSGGAPEEVTVLLEGESLFNDATSIVLFEIFFGMVRDLGKEGAPDIQEALKDIVVKIGWLSLGGAAIGLAFGFITQSLMKSLRNKGSTPPQELALTLGMAYLSFYIANSPAKASGVIAVVVYGLYGSATGKWQMSARVAEAGLFFAFWDTISFIMNGLVFCFAGASAVNFLVRSSRLLYEESLRLTNVVEVFWRLPFIYLALFAVRGLCILFFAPFIRLPSPALLFVTFSGLRGAVTLILAQTMVLDQDEFDPETTEITAQIALWSAAIVVMTLAINAPLVPWLLHVTGLDRVPPTKILAREKAKRALVRYTERAVEELRNDETEMLRGVDWNQVEEYVDLREALGLTPEDTDVRKRRQEHANKNSSALQRVYSWATLAGRRFVGATVGSLHTPLLQHDPEPDVERQARQLSRAITEEATTAGIVTELNLPDVRLSDNVSRVGSSVGSDSGRVAPGTCVQQPWPDDVSQLEGMHGNFSDDLPFMGLDMSSAACEPADQTSAQVESMHPDGDASTDNQTYNFSNSAVSTANQRASDLGNVAPQVPLPGVDIGEEKDVVLPQPVLVPCMVSADAESPKEGQVPHLWWMGMDAAAEQEERTRQGHARVTRRAYSQSSDMHTATGATQVLETAFSSINLDSLLDAEPGTLGAATSREEILAEARVRLLQGIKRYFHIKRADGLISSKGMRIMDEACNISMENASRPLRVWQVVEQEVCGRWSVHIAAVLLLQTRLFGLWLGRTKFGQSALAVPVNAPRLFLADWLNRWLSQVMLLGIEVAIEYFLALNFSPQVQWLQFADPTGTLKGEAADESKKVWKFIIDREIEAPDRFQAIQSYRAAMAVLRKQEVFVENLYNSGMIDEPEKEQLEEPIQARERALKREGAIWHAPRLLEMLRSLPFLQNVPEEFFLQIVRSGEMVLYNAGDVIWQPPKHHSDTGSVPGQGIFVVLHGIVRSSHTARDGSQQDYFLGHGAVFGLLPALVGEVLPGNGPVVAEGNVLRRGPVIFHLPQQLINWIIRQAHTGSPEALQLELDLFRVAALYVVEALRVEVVDTVAVHHQHIAIQQARNLARGRLGPPSRPSSAAKQTGAVSPELGPRVVPAGSAGSGPLAEQEGHLKHSSSRAAGKRAMGRHRRRSLEGMSDAEVLFTIDQSTIWNRVHKLADEVLADLKVALRSAEVVELQPGQELRQRSHVVLLKGTLHTSAAAAALPPTQGSAERQGNYMVEVQYEGPSVLPWVWDILAREGELGLLKPSAIHSQAGKTGAVLVVCKVGIDEESESGSAIEDEAGSSGSLPEQEGRAPQGSSAAEAGIQVDERGDAPGPDDNLHRRHTPERLPMFVMPRHGQSETVTPSMQASCSSGNGRVVSVTRQGS